MPLVYVRDETKKLLDLYEEEIKVDYLTSTLFLDSAVRSRLRGMGYKVERDLILSHLRKLEKSKARHLDTLAVKRAIERHRQRIKNAEAVLNNPFD